MKHILPQQTSFLLRLWRSDVEWRISLENPITGERNGFTSIESLVDFLKNDLEHLLATQQKEEESSPEN
jgi:hypothetical protein